MIMNNIVVMLCFLGNHVCNTLQNPDKTLVVSNQLEDSVQNLNDPELFLQNLLMNENQVQITKEKEVKLRSALLNNALGFFFNEPLKWNVDKSNTKYSKISHEDFKDITTIRKELETAEPQDKKLKNELVENKYNREILANENGYKLNSINYMLNKVKTKNTIVYSKINRDGEPPMFSSTNVDSSCLFDDIRYFLENNSAEKPVLNEDGQEINYSRKESLDPSIADNISFDLFTDKQTEDIDKQDFGTVSSNRKILKNGKNIEVNTKSSIILQTATKSVRIQKVNNENLFSSPQNILTIILTNTYQYSLPSTISKTLLPRKLVKRSSPSASSRQLEIPTVGRFPFSTAGSSLYGSYAYAQSKPFLPLGGEGEVGEPIEGGEGEEVEGETPEGR